MRRIILFLIGIMGPLGAMQALAQAPTPIPITGNLGAIQGTGQPYAGVSIQLQNCASPVSITGYFGIVQQGYQIRASSSGLITGTVWPNDLITCNGTTGNSQYALTLVVGGTPSGTTQCYQVTSTQGIWNMNTQQPVACGQSPPNPQDAQFRNLNVTGCFSVDGSGCITGGGGSPGGAHFSVQYNNSGAFGGASFNGLGVFSTTAIPRTATTSDIASLLSSLTGCGSSGNVYSPAGAECVPPGSGSNPSVGAPGAVQSAGTTTGTFTDSGCTATAGALGCVSGNFTGTAGVGGGNNYTEGTLVPPVAGQDFVQASASAHALQLSNNGGVFSSICSTLNALCYNGQIWANGTSTAEVSAPGQVSGIQSTLTGGTVAANTYACEITYIGATSGETTVSPSSSTSTSGSTSTLLCAANDAPAGATGYNVYWQTGGSGSYFLDTSNENVSFLLTAIKTATPATSGTTPPGSNTAISILSYAQSLLSGGAGTITIPNSVSSAQGNAGDPAAGQTIFDNRTGAFATRGTVGMPQKSTTGSVMGYQIYVDMNPGQLTPGTETNAIGASIEQGFTSSPYGVILPPLGGSAAGFFRNYRGGSNTNLIEAGNFVALVQNQNAIAAGIEVDCLNQSGSDATSVNGCDGLSLLSAGANKAWHAIDVENSGSSWQEGLVFNTGATTGAALEFGPKAAGTNQPSQYMQFDSVGSIMQNALINEDAFGDLILSAPTAIISPYQGTPTSTQDLFASPLEFESDLYNGTTHVGSTWTFGPIGAGSGATTFENVRLSNSGSPAPGTAIGLEIPNWLTIDTAGNTSETSIIQGQTTSSGIFFLLPNVATTPNTLCITSLPCNSAVSNLTGGALGSAPYQSAANVTAFIAGPTTSGHTFVYSWQPAGSAIAPFALDLATYLASPPAIGGTAPAAGTFTNVTDSALTSGIVKNTSGLLGNAAASDIVALFSTCSGTQYLGADGACHNTSGAGTVTSVTFTGDGIVDSSTPSTAVTTSGTVTATIINAAAHKFLGNNTGSTAAPAYDAIGASDLVGDYIAGAGSVNVMTATLSPAATSYVAGLELFVLPNLANTTTTPTLNVNGLGAKNITKFGAAALVAGDYSTTAVADFIYDGTEFQLMNPQFTPNANLVNSSFTLGSTSVSLGATVTSFSGVTLASPTFTGTVAGANTIPLTILAQAATNTVLGNFTSGTANITAQNVASCSTAADALKWTTNTGFGCNTAITAAALPLSGITAATGTNTIANGNNGAQVWNWAQTTNTQTAFTFGETTAATGTNDLQLAVTTLAGSTAVPLTITDSLTGTQTISALNINPTWNTSGVVDAALKINVTNTSSGALSKLFDAQISGTSEFNVDKGGNTTALGTLALGSSPPACTAGTAGAECFTEGTALTNVASTAGIYADSTAHELEVATAGTNNYGILERTEPGSISTTGATAAVTTATLCAASAGACNVAGQYAVHIYINQSGTACSVVGATAALTPSITWTDSGGTTRTSAFPLTTSANIGTTPLTIPTLSTSLIPTTGVFSFATSDMTIRTNGTVIQYALAYTGCTTGTFSYDTIISVTRLK